MFPLSTKRVKTIEDGFKEKLVQSRQNSGNPDLAHAQYDSAQNLPYTRLARLLTWLNKQQCKSLATKSHQTTNGIMTPTTIKPYNHRYNYDKLYSILQQAILFIQWIWFTSKNIRIQVWILQLLGRLSQSCQFQFGPLAKPNNPCKNLRSRFQSISDDIFIFI